MALTDVEGTLEATLASQPGGVVSAYLFGSYASGRPHRESDVDVAVLLDRHRFQTPAQRFEERVRLVGRLQRALAGVAVDVVVLDEAPPQLARAAITKGTRVFCADEARDHEFRRITMSRAADLEPFLRRVRRIKLDAIAR